MREKHTFVSFLLLAVLLCQFIPLSPASAAACDAALFIADVSVPDGSAYSPNAPFTKTWRLKNAGTCTWTTAYKLVFASGEQMGGPGEVALPASVAPNATVDLSVNLTAPVPAGAYRGYWQLKNAAGALFGIGSAADKPFWVAIVTRPGSAVTPVAVGEAYNFASNAGAAQNWMSGAGTLPFPGSDGDARGFAQKLDSVKLETGETVNQPALLMAPQNKTDGYIQGLFPSLAIQSGDRFQATIGCQYGSTACFVTYRIDYRTNTGTKTLWSFKEKYEGLMYNVDLDLSALAGKNAEFFLLVLASGPATGDRALWLSPRIVRSGGGTIPTNTPSGATATATSPGPTTTSVPASGCDRAIFIADVNIPDNTVFGPNTSFSKKWRIKNTGTCTWTTGYKLVFAGGDLMGGPAEVPLTSTVAPNTSVDLSVNLTSPAANGSYRGNWQLKNAAGALFGIGPAADKPFWVAIVVQGGSGPTATTGPTATSGPTATPIPGGEGYNFASNAGAAQNWMSGAGTLPFPGSDGDARGFAQKLDSVKLETGETVNQPVLLMAPQNKTDGYIQGLFPSLAIQSGDRFQTTIGCQYGSTACFVTYRIDYRTNTGTKTLWSFKEKYEGLMYNVDLDLSALAGKNAEFFLLVLASGPATGDRALWLSPRIVHAGTTPPTSTPATKTPTPAPHGDWPVYTNQKYQFQFRYPPQGQLVNVQENSAHVELPVVAGTNLTSKYLDVAAFENVSSCTSLPVGGTGSAQQVTFNGITFNKETGDDRGAGQIRQWTNYYTVKGNVCVSMGFVLHSGNLGAFPPSVVEFDFNAESAVFSEMMSTFTWLNSGSGGPPYAVVGVAGTDTLSVRSQAGSGNPLVASVAYNATSLLRTGLASTAGSAEWWQVSQPAAGWVEALYLTEYVPPTNFCSDARVNTLLLDLGNALKNSDGAAFAALVSPRHGVNIRLSSFYAPKTINFSKTAAAGLFSNATLYPWGAAPCSDQVPGSTFAVEVRPKMLEVYNSPSLQLACTDLTHTGTVAQPWPAEYSNINFYALYKPGTPGVEDDWRTLLVGVEYVDGRPYVFALYNYQWSC